MDSLRALSEKIIVSFLSYYTGYWILAIAIAGLVYSKFGLSAAAIALVAAFFVFEALFRGLFYVSYGPQYRHAVFTYLLIDHPIYGTTLRKNTVAKNLPFHLFDIFAFPINSGRIIDLKENLENRNVFTVNNLGFRGRAFDPMHKSAKLRIFCLGGSTTAGHSVNDEDTWPAHLESALREKSLDVEVINAGVHGWTSYKDYLRYKNEIVNYDADIILIHQGWNEEFLWSCLSLGKTWTPKLARNVREEHMLYSPPSRFLSSDRFFGKFLAIQALRKRFIFKRNMSFQNPKRWRGLMRREYIRAWVENMLEIAKIAEQSKTPLYAIDYPGLVSMDDTPIDRDIYIKGKGSRLTPLFADYQASSKARIEETMLLCSVVIPVLRVTKDMSSYTGHKRLPLFLDEIHLSGEGNRLFANAIAQCLVSDPAFQARYRGGRESNVDLTQEKVSSIMEKAGINSFTIDRFIMKTIDTLSGKKTQSADIPTERYTTF